MAMEGILTTDVSEILNKLIHVVGQEISLAWGVKDDLKKLQRTLEMIRAVIADAERRQVTEEAVRLWLRWLKDVAYDADDVMDEFSYESMRRSIRGINIKGKARDFISSANPLAFRFKIARKIKHINQRLDEITKDMSRFHLQTTPASNNATLPGESSEQWSRQTASSINESDIIGREDEKERIMNMLTKVTPSSESKPEKVSTVAIVGMGGLGKTTLAQLVYKDEMVNKHFEMTMWVHVSEDFDVEKLLTKIMESSTQKKFDAPLNFSVLVSKVEEQLNGKRYLLVLDDLWNQDVERWESLRSPLLVGAQGSKILITTRNDQVASVVRGSIPPYRLEKLPDDECWSIIEKKAFAPGGALNTTNMAKIGMEIAKKCSGLPLAAKLLGGLMRLKNKEVDWLSIQENDVLNTRQGQSEIIPILKLSYDNLSSELKQCFSYCSIFPKGWEINRVTLVQLWIAEGFLDPSNVGNGRSIEEIADEYFESLVWSSFLDGVELNLLGDIDTCKMHDLVHDLAKSVVGDQELAYLKVSELIDTSKIRRLLLILDEDLSSSFLKSLSNSKKLRTVFIPEGSNLDPFIFSDNNQYLRVLHVDGSEDDTDSPKWRSLSVLKHLRYLRLTSVDLSEVVYDQSIGKLYNLETLVLNCMGIGVQFLLSNIQSLRKLRYLEVSDTDMVELPDSVTRLSNLQTLDLTNCELKVIPDSISCLRNLRFLNLSVNPFEELPVSVTSLSNLETLNLNTCKKLKALPVSVSGLGRLRIFDFKNCPLLDGLPDDFGGLTHLRYLSLDGTQIRVLPESCADLNNLEYVDLFNFEVPKYVKNWRKLRNFFSNGENILGAGELVLLEGLIYSVPKKCINEAERTVGIEELRNLNFLKALGIQNLQNVEDPMDAKKAKLKGKQNLRELHLTWDDESSLWNSPHHHREVFEALQPPTGLRVLRIQNFMGLVFPDWVCVPSGLPNLSLLDLYNCTGIKILSVGGFRSLTRIRLTDMHLLEELCGSYPSRLQYLEIIRCERLTKIPSFLSLQELRIIDCKRLKEIPSFPSLMTLVLMNIDHKLVWSVGRSQMTSLTDLWLHNIEDLICFPVSILQNNSNLQILEIKRCHQLKGFGVNEDGLLFKSTILGSLPQLVLIDCAVLKFLPDIRGWTSLQRLTIFNCPQVKESLTYDLKSLSFLKVLKVDFIQRDEQRGDPSYPNELINLMNK